MWDTIYKILDLVVMPLVLIIIGRWVITYYNKRERKEEERSERRRQLELAVYPQRQKLGLDLIELFNRVCSGATAEEIVPEMRDFKDRLTLFASEDVVRGFLERIIVKVGKEQEDVLKHWGYFFLEFRKDMGYPETDLSPVEILKCFIKEEDWGRIEKIFEEEE